MLIRPLPPHVRKKEILTYNLADKPVHTGKVNEMTALLENEMKTYGDTASLVVANPAPAKWEPPAQKEERKKK